MDQSHCGRNKSQPTDAIFLPLTRAWGAEGCDEAGWGEAESHPEVGARVFRGLSHKTVLAKLLKATVVNIFRIVIDLFNMSLTIYLLQVFVK